MIEGTLIAESVRAGATLTNVNLTVRTISRQTIEASTPEQPEIWTLVEFEADEADAGDLAEAFAGVLDDQPTAWYVDFRSPAETFVVFPGRVFRYPRGDRDARAEAVAYGRQAGVPESQLDWPI
jgi:hypothetical protein